MTGKPNKDIRGIFLELVKNDSIPAVNTELLAEALTLAPGTEEIRSCVLVCIAADSSWEYEYRRQVRQLSVAFANRSFEQRVIVSTAGKIEENLETEIVNFHCQS